MKRTAAVTVRRPGVPFRSAVDAPLKLALARLAHGISPASLGMAYADWDDARRAERYRVLKQVVGVDAQPVEVANAVTESEFTLTGLPSGATVQVTIVPVNDAGDGSGTAVASLVVP